VTRNESMLPASELSSMFNCNAAGALTWKRRPVAHFRASATRSSEHIAAHWNSRYAGEPALSCVTPFGHLTGRINDRLFYAHRVVWAMHIGCWPEHEIDHINGNPGDNRIENLRDVPHLLNLRNQARRKNNTSGFTGVAYFKRDCTWSASITVNGRSIHIGYFRTPEQAQAARIAADQQHQFHPNHGRNAA